VKGVLVEIRKDPSQPPTVMELSLYREMRRRRDPSLPEGRSTLVVDCHNCRTRHELGTFAEWVAAMGGAAEYSDTCIMRAARGPQ